MHCGRHLASFDKVSEFDRGRIVAYRDCGLSFREKSVTVLDEKKQLRCESVIAECRRKQRNDHIHLVAPLPVKTGGLCSWQCWTSQPPATSRPDQLWQYVEAVWIALLRSLMDTSQTTLILCCGVRQRL
ncbi:hypothetical protein TNCV_534591 [Trichonephila clavipes]|nr:hypothetical protein TNCV_534591 [Trichonephila clavipes]